MNENYEIIDGQHRFNACKLLNAPIYFIIVSGYTQKELQALNQSTFAWTYENYLDYYSSIGSEEYRAFKDFKCKYFGSKTGISAALLIAQIALGANKSDLSDALKKKGGHIFYSSFKKGGFQFPNKSTRCRRTDF